MTGTQAMTIFGIRLFLSLLSRLETVAKFIFLYVLELRNTGNSQQGGN